jgi:nickel/cobalt exporter
MPLAHDPAKWSPVRRQDHAPLSAHGSSHAGWSAARIVLACVLVLIAFDYALAQATGPLGIPRTPASAPPDGIVGWILAKQAEFYRQFSGLVRASKADGSAVWTLLGVSFLYGVFHAAGPGHGKAVISSYLVANDETWRRGVILSAAASLLQALVAIAFVSIAAGLIGATRRSMDGAVYWIEIASYALIALMGARLTWVKGRSLIAAWRAKSQHKDHAQHGGHRHDHRDDHRQHDHGDHRHDHAAAHAAGQTHAHDHGHTHDHAHHGHAHHHDDHAGHSHGPEPQELAGPGGWQRGLSAIVAVGLRPCSGAIIVLVFALAQSLYWAGVAATLVMGVGTALTTAAIATLAVSAKGVAKRLAASSDGGGVLLMRGIEVAAALVVLLFGVALLTGYITTERVM